MNSADLYPEILRPYDPRVNPLPPPTQGVCDGPVFTICINEFWWAHVSGMIARLLYRDAWAGTDDEIDAAIASISKILNVGRPTMGCGCGDSGLPSQYSDDGVFQVSYDGGVTWVDAPQFDPRNNVTLLPKLTSTGDLDDDKCAAANSATAFLQQMEADSHAKRAAGATIAAIAEAAIAFLVVIGIIATGGALAVLGGALAAIAANASAADFDAAFTPGVWADLCCRIYCALGDDLTLSDAEWATIQDQIKTDHPGIAGDFLSKAINLMGAKALTNATRLGLNAGLSCDACHCDDTWCYDGDFTLASFDELFHSFQPSSNPAVFNTNWTSGLGWQTANGDPNYSAIQFELSLVPGLTSVCFTSTGVDAFFISAQVNENDDGTPIGSLDCATSAEWTGYNWVAYGKRSRGVITAFHMEGTGTIPAIFGLSNC